MIHFEASASAKNLPWSKLDATLWTIRFPKKLGNSKIIIEVCIGAERISGMTREMGSLETYISPQKKYIYKADRLSNFFSRFWRYLNSSFRYLDLYHRAPVQKVRTEKFSEQEGRNIYFLPLKTLIFPILGFFSFPQNWVELPYILDKFILRYCIESVTPGTLGGGKP